MTTAIQQLIDWTAPGPQDIAQRTYGSIRSTLATAAELQGRSFEVYLQGSYANHTNVRGDSDVDVVAMLKQTYVAELTRLPSSQAARWEADRTPATYHEWDFRRDVQAALVATYGSRVKPKKKCLLVQATQGYLDTDVVPALEHRLYTSYEGPAATNSWIEGIKIFPTEGPPIVNYPKEHIRNGEQKNRLCYERYKPTVRQIKRLRSKAVDEGYLAADDAPGYLLECMTYNVPNPTFISDDVRRIYDVLHFFVGVADFSTFMSCDGVHTLFGTDPGHFTVLDANRIVAGLVQAL